jgi:hypothetical protein
MQAPPPHTNQAEAIIPMETVSNDADMNRTVPIIRKVAKRTLPWDLAVDELELVSQDEDIPAARKKPRLQEHLPTTTDESARKTASPDISVDLPPPSAADAGDIDDANTDVDATDQVARKNPPSAADNDDANADHVTDTQPNDVATTATGSWTSEEDANLISAVVSTCKKKCSNEYKIDWDAVAALVPGRRRDQCRRRCIDRANGRTGTWIEDEDIELKDAVQMHSDKDHKDWVVIAALVPGRTRIQCSNRWKYILNANIDRANARTGAWTEDEDIKLKDAARLHGGKNWGSIAALVPGRTKVQCSRRWHDALKHSIDRTSGRTGKWAEDEDIKLKNAAQKHGGKDWAAIAALVPCRTKMQCSRKWHDIVNADIDRANKITGKWTADEDSKLKDVVHTDGVKNWDAVAALVPDRTKRQCNQRWNDVLKHRIDGATGRRVKWTEDEDNKLKNAVQTDGGKDWAAIALLVPGRTNTQCCRRWHDTLDPSRLYRDLLVSAVGRQT